MTPRAPKQGPAIRGNVLRRSPALAWAPLGRLSRLFWWWYNNNNTRLGPPGSPKTHPLTFFGYKPKEVNSFGKKRKKNTLIVKTDGRAQPSVFK